MRITNRMMTNNMLGNINKNKLNVYNLEQQYSTGKKIQKPSDDPIVAIRALKLRTNLTELEQYYGKNIPDADSWMDLTEGALKTINSLLKQINSDCVQGTTDTLTAENREAIVKNLLEMKNQIYQEGNTNYAGRYVFTGYKTDSSLTFMETVRNLEYKITEKLRGDQIQSASKLSGGYELKDYDDPGVTFDESPKLKNIYRLKLSYDKLENTAIGSISYSKPAVGGGSVAQPPFTDIRTKSMHDTDAYDVADDEIHFIHETGELIFGKNAYEEFRLADNIEVSYEKKSFEKGELKPEHYFDCEVYDSKKPELGTIKYTKERQEIRYEIDYNQKLVINTEGSDAISHKIGRDIDEILNCVNDVIHTEDKIAEIKKRMEDPNLGPDDVLRYEKMLMQLDTELVLKKELMQEAFGRGITSSNKEQDRVNLASADLGSRHFRLNLTEDRMSSQRVDLKELLSNNEDANMTDTLINFYSAQLIYNSSLSAAAKVVQNSLLDFIR